MPSTHRPGGGASAAGVAGDVVGVSAGSDPAAGAVGAGVCAFAADIVAAIPAAATQPATPLTVLFPMCRRYPCHIVLKGRARRAPVRGTPHCKPARLEDLFAVQYDVEAFALLVSADAQAHQQLGDHQQDERSNAAVDQRGDYSLALDPKLVQAARTAIR